jgi:serine/threonine-protein kinase
MEPLAQTTPTRTSPPVAVVGPDLTGRTLNDFHVLRRLGEGGMGQVYLAEQISLKRKVALKILRSEMASNPTALQRFEHEAMAVAKATHANIVQVYAIGEDQGVRYMALEYVEGRNLREFLAKKGPPDLPIALSIIRQVAAALQRASELGIVHRDIKPDNILLTRKGEVKVADFGLSRVLDGDQPAVNLTQSGVTMGTPLYMSPEQVEGKTVDVRTDIYSFGATCYHMLAGHPPFQGETAFEVALQHVQAQPQPLAEVRPDLPEPVCAIVHKMMAKDPAQRYQTGREILKDLSALRLSKTGTGTGNVSGFSVELPPAATPPSTQSATVMDLPRGRSRLLPALVGLSLGLALAGGVGFGWYSRQPSSIPPATTTPPADSNDVDAVLHSPQRKEKAMWETLDQQYLNPENVGKNVGTGVGLCVDLAAFYLENDRLDDAEKLFLRLESLNPAQYHVLGQLGRAIVLALRSEPKESNQLLHQVCAFWARQPGKKLDDVALLKNPTLRYWTAQALHYNSKNGLPDKEVPPILHPLLKLPLKQ